MHIIRMFRSTSPYTCLLDILFSLLFLTKIRFHFPQEIEIKARKDVDSDVKKAKADTEIDASELYNDVYENNLQGDLKGLLPWEKHPHKKTFTAQNL